MSFGRGATGIRNEARVEFVLLKRQYLQPGPLIGVA